MDRTFLRIKGKGSRRCDADYAAKCVLGHLEQQHNLQPGLGHVLQLCWAALAGHEVPLPDDDDDEDPDFDGDDEGAEFFDDLQELLDETLAKEGKGQAAYALQGQATPGTAAAKAEAKMLKEKMKKKKKREQKLAAQTTQRSQEQQQQKQQQAVITGKKRKLQVAEGPTVTAPTNELHRDAVVKQKKQKLSSKPEQKQQQQQKEPSGAKQNMKGQQKQKQQQQQQPLKQPANLQPPRQDNVQQPGAVKKKAKKVAGVAATEGKLDKPTSALPVSPDSGTAVAAKKAKKKEKSRQKP